jgi:glycosyltransferase involved in cell wall biosynthesis
MGIKYSEYLISDNIGIQEYITKEYDRNSILISYGGDQVFKVSPNPSDLVKHPFLNRSYVFSVARIQPDNNIEMLLETFTKELSYPIVFVGNWQSCSYGLKIKEKFSHYPNIILLDAIYDQRELNLLRSNCKIYLHGHSAGGTNPALVEAMNLSLPIFAFDCIFNKYTTDFSAEYFSNSDELLRKILTISDIDLNKIGEKMYEIAKREYKWKYIAAQYSEVFDK